tara:strand:+ start:322 stop:444 length:123 start_codon:yes stop_codon:yes gene_type:complete
LKNQAVEVKQINPAEKIAISRTENLAIVLHFYKGWADSVG